MLLGALDVSICGTIKEGLDLALLDFSHGVARQRIHHAHNLVLKKCKNGKDEYTNACTHTNVFVV